MVNFFRKSKVTKDVPISEIHSDKYGGLETTATIRGGRFSEKYAVEFQVPDDPTYGAGKLHRMDLGLYTTGLELGENSTSIPRVVAYKINDVSQSGAGREINEGVGNKKSDDMLVYTSQLTGYSSVSEVFNGKTTSGDDEITYEPIQRTLFRKEKPFSTPKFLKLYGRMMETGFQGGAVDIDEEKIKTNYAISAEEFGLNLSMKGDPSRTKQLHISAMVGEEGKDWDEVQNYTLTEDTVSSSSLIVPLQSDNDQRVDRVNGDDAPDAGLYKAVPLENKAGNTIYVFDNTAAVFHGNRDIIDNETYGNEVTSANSIFEYVRGSDEFIGENTKTEGASELFGVGAVRFSNKLQRTGGQSCQMYNFWKQQDDDPVTYSRKARGGPADRQECLIAKRNIPLPTKFPARPNWDNQDENHFASTIELDIYVESLERAYVHKASYDRTHYNGAVNGVVTSDPYDMITARRGLAICFSEDAPTSGQTFYDFVKHHASDKNDDRSLAYHTWQTRDGYVGQEGSTLGAMWAVTPTRKAIMTDTRAAAWDSSTTYSTDDVVKHNGNTYIAIGGGSDNEPPDHTKWELTAKNFAGVLLVMTPEGPALIPSNSYGTGIHNAGWLIDDNTKDIQVAKDSVYTDETGMDDIVGKWIRIVFKVTPDGWTCYGPGRQSNNTLVSHPVEERGIYKGQQHTHTTNAGAKFGPTQTTHSVMQVIDLGADEIVIDRSAFGDNDTDHYAINNIYCGESNPNVSHGAEFGGNSLQHWPKNLSIWSMNYKNDKNTNLGKDEFLEEPTSDTSSSIFIDAVKFNNFNFNIKNCSAKKYNPNASTINIGASSVWAGPDYPRVANSLADGKITDFTTNAPVVLSFGFKNVADINSASQDSFHNFTSSNNGTWLLFNGYQTANLGANEEIPDCNIRFGYTGGYNGEVAGGATSGTPNNDGTMLKLESVSGDGTYMKDFFVMKLDEDELHNNDNVYNGQYITCRAGTGKDQTRKIVASEYKDSDEQYVAVQPQFYSTGGTDSFYAITTEAFGNQFRNEGIGSARAPGRGLYSASISNSNVEKTMFTSRAHSISVTGSPGSHLLDETSAVWDYPGWRYNDMSWATVGSPATLDVTSTSNTQLAYKGYGTAQAGGSSTITLQSDMDGTNDAYNGIVIIIEGGTGAGQIREITDYNGTSKEATVNNAWDTVPDDTSKYRLRAAPYVGGHSQETFSNAGILFSGGVSSGTHNNWVRKYANSVTAYSGTGSPDSEPTDLQGQDDNNARFECKWFDTGYSEKGGAQINANTDIELNPHVIGTESTFRQMATTSDDYSPIRRYDELSIGSVGQTGQKELSVNSLPSAFDLVGTDADITIQSTTALPAAIHTSIDRPVYTKLPTSINNFTSKGFARFSMTHNEYNTRVFKRENLAASARVTEIKNSGKGQVTLTVDNANTLSSDDDEEYIVYLYGQMATFGDSVNKVATSSVKGDCHEGNPYSATGLKIVSRDLTRNTITLLWDGKANNGDEICTYENLPALMISPYRYWVYLVIDCTDETGQKALNTRTYRSVCWMESNTNNMAGYLATGEALGNAYDHANVAGTLAARQNLGSTWNEFKFNDTTVSNVPAAYINDWELTRMEKGSSLDCNTDYGWGPFSADGNVGGFCGQKVFFKNPNESQTENIMQLPYIVQKGGIQPKQDITLLLAFEDEALPHTLTLKSRNASDSSYDPAIYSVYWDERPAHPSLTVKPDEDDGFVPKFTWDASDEDLWYGLLHIDNRNVPSQYHNMIGHIPLNEDDATTYGGVFFENSGNQKTSAAAGAFTNSREGLAGWAKDFNGTNQYLEFTDATNFAVKPSSEMTIVLHAIPDAAQGAQATLLAKHTDTSRVTDYEIYIDTDEKINAKITPASGTTLHLKSNTILPRDGETPVSIIVTFDSNIKGGNMKLFIDGKLEDQSGLMDATGTSSNLKTGQSINQGSGKFYIGCSANGTTEEYFYDGKIEEVVIYNKCLYPVNPKDGMFKLTKPLREVENGSPITYQGRLFIKDYHNIRGSRTLDVASSSPVSFAKAGFRLS